MIPDSILISEFLFSWVLWAGNTNYVQINHYVPDNHLNCGPWIYILILTFLNGIMEINILFHDTVIFLERICRWWCEVFKVIRRLLLTAKTLRNGVGTSGVWRGVGSLKSPYFPLIIFNKTSYLHYPFILFLWCDRWSSFGVTWSENLWYFPHCL